MGLLLCNFAKPTKGLLLVHFIQPAKRKVGRTAKRGAKEFLVPFGALAKRNASKHRSAERSGANL
ncbi:hypothetical protein D0T57_09680 [Dysgonomonas sp. 511]|nr:hypothetical protein [Dysgonomonas sp. 511]